MKRIPTALHIIRLASQLGDYDSNVVGMAAEIIAEDRFGMRRVLRGTRDIDGFYQEAEAQRSVQVKGWSSSDRKSTRLNSSHG